MSLRHGTGPFPWAISHLWAVLLLLTITCCSPSNRSEGQTTETPDQKTPPTTKNEVALPEPKRTSSLPRPFMEAEEEPAKIWQLSLNPATEAGAHWLTQAKERGAPAAFRDWTIEKLKELRQKKIGQFKWHGFHVHPRRAAVADFLTGVTTPEDYYARTGNDLHFLDLYGIREAISGDEAGRIDWQTDLRLPSTWEGTPALSKTERRNKSSFRTFEFFNSLAGQYFKTNDERYRRAALRLLADLQRYHPQAFWNAYRAGKVSDVEVKSIYQIDWRSNTNGLHEAWNALNTIRILAALTKNSGDDKPQKWGDVLKARGPEGAIQGWSKEDVDNAGVILLGLALNYPEKLLWFAYSKGIANQRMETLAALEYLTSLFPEIGSNDLWDHLYQTQIWNFLITNYAPDGGMVEQSLNYNHGTHENFQKINPQNPALQAVWQQQDDKFKRLLTSIRDPLGNLPVIGNNHLKKAPTVRGNPIGVSKQANAWPESVAHPYSGYYVLRNGSNPDSTYAFFKNSRLQRGHRCHDNNGLQITALGRPLLVYGGPPDYNRGTSADVKLARTYLGEGSSLKTNTVLVDGYSQKDSRPQLHEAPTSPIASAWYDDDNFTVVDGLYDGDYGGISLPGAQSKPGKATHLRTVYFFKKQGIYLVVDDMEAVEGGERDYTQVWNFLPNFKSKKAMLDGFDQNEFVHDEAEQSIQTTEAQTPNILLLHDGIEDLSYTSYFGDREKQLGWYAPNIGQAVPAMDYHVNWTGSERSRLLTWIIPLPVDATPPQLVERLDPANLDSSSILQLADGTRLGFHAAPLPNISSEFSGQQAPTVFIRYADQDKADDVLVNSTRSAEDSSVRDQGNIATFSNQAEGWQLEEQQEAIRPYPLQERVTTSVDRTILEFDATTGSPLTTPGNSINPWIRSVASKARPEFPTLAWNYEKPAPVPLPIVDPAVSGEPGWLIRSKTFEKPTRLLDAMLLTWMNPEEEDRVLSLLESTGAANDVRVFHSLLKIDSAGDYLFKLEARFSGFLSFGDGQGIIFPTFVESVKGQAVSRTVKLQPGYYPLWLTVTGFYNTKPKFEFEVAPANGANAVEFMQP